MERIRHRMRGLSFRIISRNVMILLAFSVIVSAIGYALFTDSIAKSYNSAAFQTAETAAAIVDGDKIDEYLETGGNTAEYQELLSRMKVLCRTQGVTLIYVIAVDRTDYNSFRSVINVPSENSGYTPWEVGLERSTTNDEYKKIYEDIYEHGMERGTIYRLNNLNGREPHVTALVPVHGSDGSVTAVLCVQRPMEELIRGRRAYLHEVAVAVLILALIVSLGTAIYLRRQFVKPVRRIALEAERFAKENSRSGADDLTNLSEILEIHALGTSLDKMEQDTLDYMENIRQMSAEKEKSRTELSLAARIQADAIPNKFPAFPEDKRFDIYGSMTPAKAVGGDFYDFFKIDEDHLGIVIADVSDKGIPAALFMMVSKILIHNFAMMGASASETLERANEMITENNRTNMFVTVWFGILTIPTGQVKAVNAGHEYPIIRHADGDFELMKDKHGLAVGAMEGIHYREYEFTLEKGGTLFLYTDGLAEASNADKDFFGTKGILDALNEDPDRDPEKLLKDMKQAADAFVGDAPQFDDLTMLAVKLEE